MLYSPQYFDGGQLTELYSSMPDNMAEVSHGALDRTQFGYFQELRKHCDLTGDFLEIGPDIGLFVRYCVEFGHFSKYWLFEPNVAAHEKLRARFGGRDFEISTSLLDLSAVPDRSISAAAMIHVLDHISDPVSFLREMNSKLSSEARILIVTHDERSLMPRALGARWPAYCLQHPHLFNPQTMKQLLQAAGMKLVSCVKSTNYFPLDFLLKHTLYALGLGRHNVPSWLGFELPLRLGNIITIAAPAAE